MKLGLEFNLFLAKSGIVYISGAITQEGENVVNTYGGLINLSNRMPEPVKFKKIECGYSHALLVSEKDEVYVFGAGIYGQLGLGTEEIKAKHPLPLADVNAGDRVLMIACGANFSLAYTTLGVVYYWGMLVPEDFSKINWYPGFLTVSYPRKEAAVSYVEDDWDSFVLTDLKATFREILACDVAGRIYHCDLNYNQTLKPYDSKKQAMIGFGHKVQIGRSLHMFMDTILSPGDCQVVPESFPLGDNEGQETEESPEFETLVDNIFSIKLCDGEGNPHYLSTTNPRDLKSRLPVTVVFNNSERRLATEFPRFNYLDIPKTADPKDDTSLFNPGCLSCGGATDNQVKFKMAHVGADPQNHSLLQLKVSPF